MSIYSILSDALKPTNAYEAVTLGQLIDTLAAADQGAIVTEGFRSPHSWRGVYAYLAFSPAKNVTVAEMLHHARNAVGRTFEGWKGGGFTMNRDTPVFIAEPGTCDDSDAITVQRLAQMLGVDVAEKRPSKLPERPGIAEVHASINGEWCVVIADDAWERFKAYVCELEAIAARTDTA